MSKSIVPHSGGAFPFIFVTGLLVDVDILSITILNVSNATETVSVSIFNSPGALTSDFPLDIPPFSAVNAPPISGNALPVPDSGAPIPQSLWVEIGAFSEFIIPGLFVTSTQLGMPPVVYKPGDFASFMTDYSQNPPVLHRLW